MFASKLEAEQLAPNPILARFRKWVEGETLTDPSWLEEWLTAMADPEAESDAGRVLDELCATPYRRREREAQEVHARAVLTRLQRIAALPAPVALGDALETLADVMAATGDADDLYGAFQWIEVAAIANVLHASGSSRVAAEIVARWTAINGHVIEVEDFPTPAELTASYGAVNCTECGDVVMPGDVGADQSACADCIAAGARS